ncbi:MAG TPA: isoaspartyl peptidase/L-asparaginase, partial [Thermodesulfobacteriota bacterium]|nr:isoaspartyl peptidase/L-asparaginase [Thermodesulfobacteriota bacterium]
RRLDASLMEGRHLKSGSVIGLEGIRNPIRAVRLVMDSPHVTLTNIGARKIADANKLAPLPEPDEASLQRLEEIKKKEKEVAQIYDRYYSTVGAVAMDMYGNLASGSSTGGTLAMLPGRVGDTPIIGAGVYAEYSFGAVSCTGKGENIVRLSLSKEICMNLKNMSPNEAAALSLERLLKIGGRAGVILIDDKERFAIMHTTQYMASGYINKEGVKVDIGFMKIDA